MPDPNRVPYSYDPRRQPVQPDAEVQGSIENVKPPPYSFAKFIKERRNEDVYADAIAYSDY